MAIHPCVNCIYFKACGNTSREVECKGRMTRTEKKKEDASYGRTYTKARKRAIY